VVVVRVVVEACKPTYILCVGVEDVVVFVVENHFDGFVVVVDDEICMEEFTIKRLDDGKVFLLLVLLVNVVLHYLHEVC